MEAGAGGTVALQMSRNPSHLGNFSRKTTVFPETSFSSIQLDNNSFGQQISDLQPPKFKATLRPWKEVLAKEETQSL